MSDRQMFSPTDLAQLERCEQQVLFDRKHRVKRTAAWRARSAEGTAVHKKVHREVTRAPVPRSRLVSIILGLIIVAALAMIWVLTR